MLMQAILSFNEQMTIGGAMRIIAVLFLVLCVTGPLIHGLMVWSTIRKEEQVIKYDKSRNLALSPIGWHLSEVIKAWGKPYMASEDSELLHRFWQFYGSRFEMSFDRNSEVCVSFRHEKGLWPSKSKLSF